MKKKWIGLFLSLLLLTVSIAPNAYAVTQSSTSDELKNGTYNRDFHTTNE
ncbi:hypothetical protein Q3F38_07595 [Enterococcus faecium]|nr:hypothetical protein [Enterococcus faecium]